MKLPKFFCKILGHKTEVAIGMDFGKNNGVMVEAIFCKRCRKFLEIIGEPFIATQR